MGETSPLGQETDALEPIITSKKVKDRVRGYLAGLDVPALVETAGITKEGDRTIIHGTTTKGGVAFIEVSKIGDPVSVSYRYTNNRKDIRDLGGNKEEYALTAGILYHGRHVTANLTLVENAAGDVEIVGAWLEENLPEQAGPIDKLTEYDQINIAKALNI